MEFITRKNSVALKILTIILITLILIFSITPNYSVQATEVIEEEDMPDAGGDIMGSLLKQIIQLIAALGDIAMGVLNHFMLGADGLTSAMLPVDDVNINEETSWLYVGDDEEIDFEYGDGTIDTSEFFVWTGDTFDIPNFLYSPEAIFSNNIAALDVNFLNPNTYTAVADTNSAREASESSASGTLRQTISDWYISFRNIAIVGLLSVLVYLGIRILISSTAVDKAKYKESLRNWVVALCLVFFIHFIMSGLLMITDQFTNLFSDAANRGIKVQINDNTGREIKFRTNLIGFARFNAQSVSMYNTAAYTIIYIVLVIYTYIFTFIYFKRFLYMAFFTMIAPLVALTYPIDKVGDGKAQAFNLWFKEYTMNLILQPVHLILYVALVSSAMDLVKQNFIYAIVAIAFLIPAEKFIKKMFGFDKAETPSGFGSFAAGAATMSGLKQVASVLGGGKNKGNVENNGNSTAVDKNANNRVRTQDRGFLESFGRDNQDVLSGNEEPINLTDTNNVNESIDNVENDRNSQQSLDLQGGQRDQQQNINMPRFVQNEGYMADENHSGIMLPTSYRMDQQQQEARDQRELQQQEQQNQADQLRQRQEQTAFQNTNVPVRASRGEYVKRRAIRGAKTGLKYALKGAKLATQAAGIMGGATVGLAAGLTTGDMSKTLTYMGAGALAGRKIGKGVGNLPERGYEFVRGTRDTIEDKVENHRYNKDKDMYGVGYAAEQAAIRQNQREQERFLKDKKEQAKYEEMAGRIKRATGQDVEAKDLMRSAFDYKKAGITDEKQIENGLTMETKHGGVAGERHDNMIDIVKMANSYGKDYVLDEKKRNSIQEMIKTNVSGEQNQNDVWNLYTEALDMKKYGKKYAINPRTNTSNSPQAAQTRPPRQARSTNPPRRPSQS